MFGALCEEIDAGKRLIQPGLYIRIGKLLLQIYVVGIHVGESISIDDILQLGRST